MENNYTNFLWFVLLSMVGSSCDSSLQFTIKTETDRLAGAPILIELSQPLGTNMAWMLVDEANSSSILLQQIRDGAWMGLLNEDLPKGAKRTYRLKKTEVPFDSLQASAKAHADHISLQVGTKEVFRYQTKDLLPSDTLPIHYTRSGFIHPVFSPAGEVLTDDFPTGHTHQHAIFMAWVNTEFKQEKVDFWNQQKETGTVQHLQLDTLVSGPVFALLKTRLQHLSLKHGVVLEETWTIRLYTHAAPYIWELQSEQVNTSEDTLHILKYHYGGMAIRGSKHWNSKDIAFKDSVQYLGGSKARGTAINHTRPKWLSMYGELEKKQAGIALMDHPDNFRYPQFVRVHPTMPYFCFAPMVDKGFDLAPKAAYTSKYRFVVYDEIPDSNQLNLIFEDFAHPITAERK